MLAARSVLRTQAQLASAARVNTVARALSTSSVAYDAKQRADSMQRVTVFGAGLMGAGIAQVSAQAGLKVTLTDVTDKALENGINIIKKSVARVAKKQQPDDIEGFTNKVLQNISTSTDAGAAVADTDLVVEAILENLKVKQDLFAFLDTKAKADTIFASNTSSLSIGEIALKCSEERQTQFAGLHFFNPVPAMKLVEVVRTPKTSQETFDTLLELSVRLGKVPVKCKDMPGFIVNRLLVPYLLEAVRMVERGDATPEDIDIAMKLGAGYPMGPFELLDFIGLDTTQFIAQGWITKAEEGLVPLDLIKPTDLMAKLVEQGKLGRKSGAGFYDYSSGKPNKG